MTKRDDGRFGFVEIECGLDVALDPPAGGPGLVRASRPRRARLLRRRLAHAAAALRVARERRGGAVRVLDPGRHALPRPAPGRGGARPRRRGDALQPRAHRAPSSTRRSSTCTATATPATWTRSAPQLGRGRRHLGARPALGARLRRAARRPGRAVHVRLELLGLRRHERAPARTRARPCSALEDETVEEITSAEVYGGLKVLCERAAEEALPGRALVSPRGPDRRPVRPDRPLHVLGAPDRARRRGARARAARPAGAARPRPRPGRLDARRWRQREAGVFNATGPERPLTMEDLLEAIREATGSDARLVWVDERASSSTGSRPGATCRSGSRPGRTPSRRTSSPSTSPRRWPPACASARSPRRSATRWSRPRPRRGPARPGPRAGAARAVSAVAFDVAAVRARFSALDRPTAFLDAPGGTPGPDSVIEAMAAYLRESNANLGGAFETSRRSDALIVSAHHTAARFLGCDAGRGRLRPEHDDAQLRAHAHARPRAPGRRRDRRHATRPRRQRLAVAPARRDLDLVVRFADLHEEDAPSTWTTSSGSSASGRASSPSRWPRTPSGRSPTSAGSSSSRTTPARSPGSTPSTTRRTAPSTSASSARTCSSARRTSSSGRTSASSTAGASCSSAGGRTRCARSRRADRRPLRDRHALARGARRLRRGGRVHRVGRLGGDPGPRARAGRAAARRAAGRDPPPRPPTMEGRVPTFAVTVPGLTAEQAATRLAERDLAVWWGDYYALEVMTRLGLPDGAAPARDHPLQHRRRGRPPGRRPTSLDARLMLRLYWARNDGMGGHVFLGLEDLEQLLEEMTAQGMSGLAPARPARAGDAGAAGRGRLRALARLARDEGARRREALARLARLPRGRGRERRRRRPLTQIRARFPPPLTPMDLEALHEPSAAEPPPDSRPRHPPPRDPGGPRNAPGNIRGPRRRRWAPSSWRSSCSSSFGHDDSENAAATTPTEPRRRPPTRRPPRTTTEETTTDDRGGRRRRRRPAAAGPGRLVENGRVVGGVVESTTSSRARRSSSS